MSTARGAKWGLNVFIAQSVERATVNRKVTGSIPVKNDLEQLLELREHTVSRTLPSRKEGFKGTQGSPSVGIAQRQSVTFTRSRPRDRYPLSILREPTVP